MQPGDLILFPPSRVIRGSAGDFFPVWLFAGLAVIGVLSAVLVLLSTLPLLADAGARLRGAAVRPPMSPAMSIVAFATFGYTLACTLPAFFGLPMFDRYLLPLVPLVGVLVLYAGRTTARMRNVRVLGGITLVTLAVLGAVYATYSATLDRRGRCR